MTETELIRSCKEGDPKGQKFLFEKYVNPMSRLCLRYLYNESDAVEAMSEGFVKVYRTIQKFQYSGEGSFMAWITKIMVNESLMYLRKSRKLLLNTNLDEAGLHQVTDSYVEKFEAEYLYEAIRKLPHGYGTVFNLYEIEGFSHKEIADLLGITESSSRAQLTRVKSRLRELLENSLNQ
ncbi:sigma-70 family RNA polymerase sigma factor [Fulvivirga ulvae]|uniref:RNA polymerase sigma factor n=1 Tax=Fulvivirga ulvae TaxID=2904245 RepID=UPI001F284176|nr:sigma-70 family RNA polymerase sigma factor [Fulvivirga ulvae]UII29955.1 sigma-70 family RNA polymerase sigma factor [Fulvivirga ulvae]